jgi:hypothetical protein
VVWTQFKATLKQPLKQLGEATADVEHEPRFAVVGWALFVPVAVPPLDAVLIIRAHGTGSGSGD